MSPLPKDKKEEIEKLIPQDSFGKISFGISPRWDIWAELGKRDINDIPNIARQLALCFKNN